MKANQCLYTPTDWNRECDKALHRVLSEVKSKIRLYNFIETGVLYVDDTDISEMYPPQLNQKIELYGQKYTSIHRDGHHFLLMDLPEF